MASDVVQVQRIAIWNTSGARHLHSVCVNDFVLCRTHTVRDHADRSHARHPSSCCTIRSQQPKVVPRCTSSPSLPKAHFFESMASFPPHSAQLYYDAKHSPRASTYHSAKAALRAIDPAPFAGWPVKEHAELELFTLSQNK